MIKERIAKLRALMNEKGIDAYMVPTDDYHCSEYVGDFFKCRKYITGFTGSAGTALILKDEAGLWTDGRYFIQAAQQLEGSGVELYKMAEPDVPTIEEFLKEKLTEGMTLGYDGRVMAATKAEAIKALMAENGVRVVTGEDLVGDIWTDRPALSCEPVFELDTKWSGKTRAEKLAQIRESMKEAGADGFLLSALEDIAWLLNIRGNDVHTCPVVLAYLYMTQEEVHLYTNVKAYSEEIQKNLAADGVEIFPYDSVYEKTARIPAGKTVLIDKDKLNDRLFSAIPKDVKILDQQNLTLLPKALKNPVEVANERIAHVKDGVAVIRFIYWLKQNVAKETITEISAAEKLLQFRKEGENFLDNSFDPIISYGPHAAIVHYSATEETDVQIEPHGLLLADTGGHYLEGSTDITRTIVMGELTEEEKRYFTLVLKGNLNLGAAKFRYGCTGVNLDYLAKAPLWEIGEDYNHGTGHGVGYCLSVHEGPNSIRWRATSGHSGSAVFEEGMITSDEPGYYKEGAFGIRHENLMVCKKAEKTEYGQFMVFETLTMVPFDLDAVLPELLTEKERILLNNYHAKVYETIAPSLNEEERTWLANATRAI
jgi:Xaa-Pro aminopeptidase